MAAPALSGDQIRETFLKFFEGKGHRRLPSASLIPEDPTVLLTIAGMLPFKPIFLGQQVAEVPRATTSQKCIRTNDIENVGRTARHHTFFEMLGNFSFGDYFKKEAIAFAWELVTEVFQVPAERLAVSVFEEDDEAFAIWRDQIGVPEARIQRLGAKDNFWASGPTGPCGPCSEIYYDFHPELGNDGLDLEDDSRFIEVYNLVFMQYNRDAAGNLTALEKQNIDTGMGLERMAQVLQGVPNNYETDLIFPIIQAVAAIAQRDYASESESVKVSLKVIGDHLRAVTHLIADGVTASNLGRGYVLRRLIRRVVRHGRLIGIDRPFTAEIAETAIALMAAQYPNLREREAAIKAELTREEQRFLETLERGEKLLAELLAAATDQIRGEDAFVLYDTYGFPLELTQEIAEEKGLTVDLAGFEAAMAAQRQRSQAAHETIDLTVQGSLDRLAEQIHPTEFVGYGDAVATAKVTALLREGQSVEAAEAGDRVQIVLDHTPFYAESGGQVGDRGVLTGESLIVRIEDVQKESGFFVHYGQIERGLLQVGDSVTAQIDRACRRRAQANHTATHLLQAALKLIVDEGISQAGSLVAFDRLRFDFNCPRAVTPEELRQIEDQINQWIAEAHGTVVEVMPIATAKAKGAVAMFGEKYGAEVRVIDVPGVSMELCGGTHVANTAEIGLFKIISEAGVASGVRRIEAVAGPAVLEYLNVRDAVVRDLSDRFKAKPEELSDRVTALQEELKANQKQLTALKAELAIAKSDALVSQAIPVGDAQVLVETLTGVDAAALQTAAERLQQKLGDAGAVVLGSSPEEGKVTLVAAFGPAIIAKGLKAGQFIGGIAKICGGGGGGRPNLAQAGGRDASKLPEAIAAALDQLKTAIAS
ncbi:alanine--tRNA ligase [Synechococcus elongatus]|uniref:Alanine--tRNA ligase n=1 Tax=Synechococcus elongatus (strain ATCC 33912 / PCC 7942 / FACHB-805) TaxID=1140 RepID=SYA_SYNE7|nr:alanine--tRNA ligase [Synechococcus elongatus]Q31PW3.2 RecName: Full=Alanine--tRNA ligase; AltName: Full=Alanyl-tRNA synthetase; Short=AlaRS [Synechococcus elongatus PCC 7942 = FACHB-805]AJD58566.1 alanyl-tRNA synthetase [Synechococcus elongatus UTEX 2973]MBD2588780.1 alanine--tRNA ligase [Synechococcus elongatus FACHB-242]MBD2689632.1 alanine--tRNA ligase [Synechococcus elongatus FACHB-1061]MBD2708238.1 alanine--tRNA ligase [Synechococcus elongatus PCC 7942 = FACHB-805]UOW70678.1 alanyl-t